MTKKSLDRLLELGILEKEKYEKLVAIQDRKVFSVYLELRSLLYIGVLLFSTGVGILIYNNIGQIGHYISLLLLVGGIVAGMLYVAKHHHPYTNLRVLEPNPYSDYVLLLVCLLFLSVLGYLQFLFGIFDNNLDLISLLAAAVFFVLAYRYDHLGVLSMAITALASFCGIAFTPMKWYDVSFLDQLNLEWIGFFFGVGLFATALVLNHFGIKKHFTKTYLNFAIIIGFTGCNALIFSSAHPRWMAVLQLVGATALALYSLYVKTMLYMIYAFVFGFIALSYLIFSVMNPGAEFIFMYLFASCAGFIYLVILLRKIFKTDS